MQPEFTAQNPETSCKMREWDDQVSLSIKVFAVFSPVIIAAESENRCLPV